MKESAVILTGLLIAGTLFSTTAAQLPVPSLPNIPSSPFLSRDLEPPLADSQVPSVRFIPQENQKPPNTSSRQTIFSPPNGAQNNNFATGASQNFGPTAPPSTISRTPSYSTFSTSSTAFANFQTSTQLLSPRVPGRQGNLVPTIQSSQRPAGGINFDAPPSRTASRIFQSTPLLSSRSAFDAGSSTQSQRDTYQARQTPTTPSPTQSVSTSNVKFSSSNVGSFSYSSGQSATSGVETPPSGRHSGPRIPSNFIPVFVNAENRSPDVPRGGNQPSSDSIATQRELLPPLPVASGRSLNSFASTGQTNQFPLPQPAQQPRQRSTFNPPEVRFITIPPGQTPRRQELQVELLPPLSQNPSPDRSPPASLITENQTPFLQQAPRREINIVGPADRAQSFPPSPEIPRIPQPAPVTNPPPPFNSLFGVTDFKIQTIRPVIQDITTGPTPKEQSFLNPFPTIPTLVLDLQPPFPSGEAKPSPPAFDSEPSKSLRNEKILKIVQQPQDQFGNVISTPSSLTISSTNSDSTDEFVSTVLTFSTPLTPTPQPVPANLSFLPRTSPAITPSQSTPETVETTPEKPTPAEDSRLSLDETKPPKNEGPFVPQSASKGFIIFQTHTATPTPTPTPSSSTNQSSLPSTVSITHQGNTGVIKPPPATELQPSLNQQTESLTARSGVKASQVNWIPQIEQGSIFPSVVSPTLPTLPLFSETSQITPTTSTNLPNQSNSNSDPPFTKTTDASLGSTAGSSNFLDSRNQVPAGGLATDLLPPFLENSPGRKNVAESPFLPLLGKTEVSRNSTPSLVSPSSRFSANTSFSATHGPGTPCVQLDIQHKGYRAPQFGGNILLSPGYYPEDNATSQAKQCDKRDVFDGRKFNWWQVLLNHGGEPSAMNASSQQQNARTPPLKNPCIRPFETYDVPVYYNHTLSDQRDYYREEVTYHRFPGTSRTFLESRGLFVWRQARSPSPTVSRKDTTSYLLHYTRDDTGFWLKVENVDCEFRKSEALLECYSISDCNCSQRESNRDSTGCSTPRLVLSRNLIA